MMISEATPFSHPFNFNDIQRVHPLSASPGNSSFFRTTSPVQSSSTMDDVTTIFVVGFPEDMAEREFQNMFIFCQGFEAASLKWHCKDGEEESIPSNGGKKQMIGFARFRTRLEALEAIEVLSGKKIDQEKGTVLKAEMAKKNLHIKRGSATQTSTSTSSSTCSTTITPAPSSIQPSAINELKSRYDSFSPLPTDLLSQDLYDSSSFNDSLFGIRSQSFDQDLGFISSRAFSLHHQHPSQLQQQQQQQQQHPIHHQHQQQQQQQHQHPIQHQHQHPIQQQQYNNNNDPYHYLSKSTPVDRFDSVLEHDLMRMGSLSINTSSMDLRSPSISSPTTTTTTTTTSTSLLANRLPNPADQNPPCNTLYVGNLPPNTSEEELRLVFSNCKGYRRMCFRTKPQGPMCFVEFEDIVFASQALNELQGHNLTNSVKGGIRLSYSKNPLFIKPTSSSGNKENGLMSFKQMGNALLNRDYMFDPQL
ncbi:uncharacterized protein EV154DRAFT_598339 [Mucor mucedo]|uniref:uncharacterized protein n=1 Tax=Mucor mucedo TaxID=29922 RepID=UPI002220490E|nr:uncharacterized protein EV154DRAFT_598339 [Mucor mucedo]KAI7896385.1 hypothetical protein EV154DRAFT_598339 [Mucor mucedo]